MGRTGSEECDELLNNFGDLKFIICCCKGCLSSYLREFSPESGYNINSSKPSSKTSQPMPRSPSVRTLIKHLEPDELREVIIELSKLTPKNKQFLKLYLQSSDAVDVESIVDEAKKKIHGHFYGGKILPKVNLSAARKTVNEYSKILREHPCYIADIKLYYVEVGTTLTKNLGI
jgi:hypothetical protein